MKKLLYLILIIMSVLMLSGCKKNKNETGPINEDINNTTITAKPTEAVTETPTPVQEGHEGEMRSYLTGLWVSEEIGTSRPFAYQFNNLKIVSNQWGIGQADIVYECLVEGGITRLLAIGENFSGDRLGSTRSARHYFVSIADEYDAIYIHFGGTKYAYSKMKELKVDELDGLTGIGASVFYRDKSIKAPHNAFSSLEGIQKGIEKSKFETKYPTDYQPHYTFYPNDTNLTGGSLANNVSLKFSAYASPYFEYNATDQLYYRFQYDKKHTDSLTGEQLSFKNIIIQFVKEWDIDKKGYQTMDLEDATGSGFYISNGLGIPITWKKDESKSFMRYYNEAGEELTINPGKTFIALFPNNRTGDVVIR